MPENLVSEVGFCDEWNKLPGWVVNVESMNNLKENLNDYLMDNKGFK